MLEPLWLIGTHMAKGGNRFQFTRSAAREPQVSELRLPLVTCVRCVISIGYLETPDNRG